MSEEKPFLSIDEEDDSESVPPSHSSIIQYRPRLIITLLVHISVLVAYTVVFIALLRRTKTIGSTSLNPLPGLNIRYIPQLFVDFEESPYAGLPNPSIDKAWHDLLSTMTVRVTEEELAKSNQTSVQLPEGGGYMAWLSVYHQLHCVKMLRQWNYRDYYHKDMKPEEKPHWDVHADHCLDLLRSTVMCHADTTLTTFGWQNKPRPMPHTRPIAHRCVDWEAFEESVRDRVVWGDEIAALENPLL